MDIAQIAAAFARLCVETLLNIVFNDELVAAAFARLCVETALQESIEKNDEAAAFARLCVETNVYALSTPTKNGSRLRAAVC